MNILSKAFRFLFAPRGTYSQDSDLYESSNDHDFQSSPAVPLINPATALPMMGDIGGVDVGGNPYAVDLHDTSHWQASNDDFGWHSGGSDPFNHDC